MSKKISIIVLTVILVLAMVIPSSTVFAASNLKVKTVEATQASGKVTVTGEVDAGMLAVAVSVYDKDGNFVKLETGSVNTNNKYEVILTLPEADYTIKVADFDGGEVTTKELKKDSSNENTNTNTNTVVDNTIATNTTENEKANSPKTGDNITIFFVIFAVAAIGTLSVIVLNKKGSKAKRVSKH